MATTIRPEVSERGKYWVERHRYYELKHFCLQYPTWKRAYAALGEYEPLAAKPVGLSGVGPSGYIGDPTWKWVESRTFLLERIEMIERVAKATEESLSAYILAGVTEGLSFDQIKARFDIPCCKDVYYILYRKFFWLLNRARN